MIWGFCVYFVYMIPLETDVLRKHRFQKSNIDISLKENITSNEKEPCLHVNACPDQPAHLRRADQGLQCVSM